MLTHEIRGELERVSNNMVKMISQVKNSHEISSKPERVHDNVVKRVGMSSTSESGLTLTRNRLYASKPI